MTKELKTVLNENLSAKYEVHATRMVWSREYPIIL